MIVDCPSCGATYNISDEKVRGRRVRVRCKNCSGPIIVDGEQIDAEDATRVYQPSFEPNTYEDTDESTRVMSVGASQVQESAPGAWTVNVGETDQRSMMLEEIVDTYNAGFITEEAFVWRDGMADWMPLMEVEEIRSAIESGQATQVVKPTALRAPARRAAANPPTPVTYSAPSAPPRARLAAVPSSSVEYAPPPRTLPKAPTPAPAPARVRSAPRNAGQDLFGGIASAGSEQELLRSSSMPLEEYKDKPIGARNESSVLFSLNTVKAGVGNPASAPPRGITASPPTAADILGMDASGGLPGVDMNAALISAPAVEQPPPPREQVRLPPVRNRMDTLPPVARRSARPLMMAAVVIAAGAMVAGLVIVLRSRLAPAPRVATPVAAEGMARSNDTSAAAAAPSPSSATPLQPSAEATSSPAGSGAAAAAPEPVAPAVPTAAAPAPQTAAPVPESPAYKAPAPGRPAAPVPRPDKGTAAAKPEKSTSPDKGDKKIVLEEEPSEAKPAAAPEPKAEAPSEPAPAAESDKPPFDMSAAKAALETAASSAPSCKSADGPTGKGKVQVTFSPSGRATSATVIEGAFGGTSVGGCIAKLFRAARVPAFSGDPVTVAKSFTVPE